MQYNKLFLIANNITHSGIFSLPSLNSAQRFRLDQWGDQKVWIAGNNLARGAIDHYSGVKSKSDFRSYLLCSAESESKVNFALQILAELSHIRKKILLILRDLADRIPY